MIGCPGYRCRKFSAVSGGAREANLLEGSDLGLPLNLCVISIKLVSLSDLNYSYHQVYKINVLWEIQSIFLLPYLCWESIESILI